MSNVRADIKQIRNSIIRGVSCQYLPLLLIGLFESQLESTPGIEALVSILGLIAFVFFCYGYVVCAVAADEYAAYKGYRNFCFIYSILNIFGLSLLFLLKNKNLNKYHNTNEDPLEKFSIASIFTSYLAIPLVIMPLYYIPGLIIMGSEFVEYTKSDWDFKAFTNFIMLIPFVWYFFGEMKNVNLDRKTIFGSSKKLVWKLPIGLAVLKYFFNGGINAITLYSLSFIAPSYVENQINKEYATSLYGWILFAFSALIYAPIMEELFFRGIIFQKLAIKKSIATGLLISAILFAAIHFRFDFIPLCLSGVITAILYFKTKQLATSIIFHFTYNLMVVLKRLYDWLFPDPTLPAQATIPELQQYFVDNLGIYALYLAITVPYFIYFVCKNFPRNREIDKLPYFVNQ